jgi:alpha-L-arabinofuranosidase
MGMASIVERHETLRLQQGITRIALLAIVGAVAGICVAQPTTVTLNIQLDKPAHSVSPMLYGLMTEEINYSYDGGLYAEMVRNRTFQDHGFDGVAH